MSIGVLMPILMVAASPTCTATGALATAGEGPKLAVVRPSFRLM